MGDADGKLPSLADTIAAVRRELGSAQTAGQGRPVEFRIGPVELEFEIAVTRTGDGQAGVQLWVLTLSGKNNLAHATTQRIKVTLRPLDPETGEEAQVTDARQEHGVIVPQTPAESALSERPVRGEDLEVHEIADGLVVYQAQSECIHHLNNTAAIVFELCDGENSVAEITEQLAAAFGLTEVPAGMVERCIVDLRSKGVVS